MNKFLLSLAAMLFSFNAFATVSIDVCEAGTLGGDDHILIEDVYDDFTFSFHETSFAVPVDAFKFKDGVVSVTDFTVLADSEGVQFDLNVSLSLYVNFAEPGRLDYSFDGGETISVVLSCKTVDAGE